MKQNLLTPVLRLLAAVFAVAGATAAHAHPGHGLFDRGLQHTLTSTDHLLFLGTAGAALFAASFLARKGLPRHSLRIAGTVLAAIALAVWRITA